MRELKMVHASVIIELPLPFFNPPIRISIHSYLFDPLFFRLLQG